MLQAWSSNGEKEWSFPQCLLLNRVSLVGYSSPPIKFNEIFNFVVDHIDITP
jgi:hypothetical protein